MVASWPGGRVRIALVSPYDISVPSGVNAHIFHLADEFRARDHEVTIFAPGPASFRTEPGTISLGAACVPIPSGGSIARVSISPRAYGYVKRALVARTFDVVHLHEPLVPMLPLLFTIQARAVKVGTFHAAHENGNWMYSLARWPLRRWARHLDARIAVSPAAARLALRYFPGDYDIIPNGVDVERFSRHRPLPPAIQDATPYILFVGRFERRKGLAVLLRAFAQLKPRFPDVHLVVVGEGNHRRRHEAWVHENRVPDVHFLGRVSDEDLPAFFQHAAVYCAPNTGNESFGIVLLEAMASGCPVVASDIEGFAAVVSDGANGILVPPREPAALAGALASVLSSHDRGQRLAAEGRRHVEQFSWPRVAGRVLAYYENLLATRRPAGSAALASAGKPEIAGS